MFPKGSLFICFMNVFATFVSSATTENINVSFEGDYTTSSTTSVTLRPLDVRRCFEGFVCEHGVCSSTLSSCVCDAGWAGVFCQTTCTFDCGLYGVCGVLGNGTEFCRCHLGYTGRYCEGELDLTTQHMPGIRDETTPSTPSPSPTPSTACPPGFPCMHGYCPSGHFKCECESGWTGAFCGTPCTLECGGTGTCRVVGGQQVCVCPWGYSGASCQDLVQDATHQAAAIDSEATPAPRTAPTSASTAPASTTPASPSASASNSASTSSLRPLPERVCVPGFVCQHGLCSPGQLKCVCDPGWVGVFCHTPCSLDCGQFGQCTDTPAGQRCACAFGFTGPRCVSAVNVTGVEQGSSDSTSSTKTIPRSPSPAPAPATTKLPTPTTTSTTPSTTSITPTTLRPLPLRQCVPGSSSFVCKHGYCYKGQKNQSTIVGALLKCICDPGWIGVFCHDRCPMDCGDHGQCDVFQNGTVYCSCTHEYMGVHCETLRPKPKPETVTPDWHWWVVGSCVFLLLLLLLLLILLPYILWRRRFIFIMKIIYMFQPFEDDDEKIFDAFVSYKSTKLDEDFVVHTLYPRLEKSLNFKLCLHFRDFMPGETIANNIINAVENSRRTILILTPSYIQSEFCRFEYQKAQHEMLKRKQRLIPIVLQDISQDRVYMDETLRTILDTITYIEWPVEGSDKKVEKFWKRLELSMPKKRESESLSNNNDTTSDAYSARQAYSFPMNFLPETPENDRNGENGYTNDSFTDSSDGFHSIDINDPDSPCVPRRAVLSTNILHNSFH